MNKETRIRRGEDFRLVRVVTTMSRDQCRARAGDVICWKLRPEIRRKTGFYLITLCISISCRTFAEENRRIITTQFIFITNPNVFYPNINGGDDEKFVSLLWLLEKRGEKGGRRGQYVSLEPEIYSRISFKILFVNSRNSTFGSHENRIKYRMQLSSCHGYCDFNVLVFSCFSEAKLHPNFH